MKSFRELINFKKSRGRQEMDVSKEYGKYVERLFVEVLGKINKNISRSDIKNFYLKKNILYLKTVHPSVASEIWRIREKIKNEINKKAEEEIIDAIRVN